MRAEDTGNAFPDVPRLVKELAPTDVQVDM